MYYILKKTILFVFFFSFINIYCFSQNEINSNQIKPDTRLYECFDKTYIQQLQKDNPELILYYNF
jgi:hypothetical protein